MLSRQKKEPLYCNNDEAMSAAIQNRFLHRTPRKLSTIWRMGDYLELCV